MDNNKYLDKFFNEYGYLGNLDNLYHSSYQRIVNTITEAFPFIRKVKVDYDSVMSEKYCILNKLYRTVTITGSIDGKRTKLLELPYPTEKGYFILDGLEWSIISLDVAYSTMLKVIEPDASEINKIKWEIEMRNEKTGSSPYRSTFLFMDINDRIGVYINTFNSMLCTPRSNSKTYRYLNPYVVYKILNPSATPNTFRDDITDWMIEKTKDIQNMNAFLRNLELTLIPFVEGDDE